MIKAKDLVYTAGKKGFENVIVRGVNLELKNGQTLGVFAEEKSGKSTLAAILTGCLRPEFGHISTDSNLTIGLLGDSKEWIKKVKLAKNKVKIFSNTETLIEKHPTITLLVIDDAENYLDESLITILEQRRNNGHLITVLLSKDKRILDYATKKYQLVSGYLQLLENSSVNRKSNTMMKFSPKELKELVMRTFCKNNINSDISDIVAEILIDAEIRGHSSHGLALLPMYLQRVKKGGINPNAKAVMEKTNGIVSILDGNSGFGQVVGTQAAELCAKQATTNGISAVAIKNNNHIGMLAAYRKYFEEYNTIGLLLNISGPSVSAPNAQKATLGSNTYCLIAPIEGKDSFIVDLGTGVVSAGKIRDAYLNDRKIPADWLKDRNGLNSDNPKDLDDGGSIPIFGGYKGLGISIIVEILAGMLAAGKISPDVKKQRKYLDETMGCSQLFIGFSKEFFGLNDVNGLIESLKEAVLSGYDEVPKEPFFPNQLELMHKDAVELEGIKIPYTLVKNLGWINEI